MQTYDQWRSHDEFERCEEPCSMCGGDEEVFDSPDEDSAAQWMPCPSCSAHELRDAGRGHLVKT